MIYASWIRTNEDIYIHANILTQENIIPQNSNKKYIWKQICRGYNKWHY